MTLKKAIERLTFLSREGTQDMELDDYDAVRLGIEALKYIRHTREIKVLDPGGKLPGETVEGK